MGIALMAKEFYFGDTLTSEDLIPYLNLVSDTWVGYGTHYWIRLVSDLVPVYYYQLDFQTNSSFSYAADTVGLGLGTAHGDELVYLYLEDDADYSLWSDAEVQFSRTMCRLWSNFVSTGTPATGEDEADWIPYTSMSPFKMS